MRNNKNYQNYFKYTSAGIQFLVTVLLGFFSGRFLDNRLGIDYGLFTIIFSLLMIGVAMYQLIKYLGK